MLVTKAITNMGSNTERAFLSIPPVFCMKGSGRTIRNMGEGGKCIRTNALCMKECGSLGRNMGKGKKLIKRMELFMRALGRMGKRRSGARESVLMALKWKVSGKTGNLMAKAN